MPPVDNDSPLPLTRTIAGLRAQISQWRMAGHSIALIPTMGALHEGHLSLITQGRKVADRTLASIFVNPAQFAAHEDLGSYPRQEGEDLAKLAQAGCDFAFLPAEAEIYPPDAATSVHVNGVSSGLCGTSRPHFFGGVATIVTKLLNQCQPDFAIFGEKDYQQLLVIRRLVKDLHMPVAIIGAPLVREADGLAMSSRNQYLTPAQRQIAGQLNKIMEQTIARLHQGTDLAMVLDQAKSALRTAGFNEVDYLEVRHSTDLRLPDETLLSATDLPKMRLFAAVILGETRLIDNMPLTWKRS